MPRFAGSLTRHPARVSFFWFASAIVLGTVLLTLPLARGPRSRAEKAPISTLDAAFTSTSAVCVTGLAVRSTGHDFSFWGQVIIAGLVQVGGIGIMTVTTFVSFTFGARESLRQRAVISETLGAGAQADIRWVLRGVLVTTGVAEAIGAAIMSVNFMVRYGYDWKKALWYGVFHSITAFCNAGFGLEDDNLTPYQHDPVVNLTIVSLIVLGGIGFPVILDWHRHRSYPLQERWNRLLLHSKLMLVGTVALLTLGTLAFLILEWDGVLQDMSLLQKLQVSLFQATTPRTAGFNTVDYARMSDATLLITMLLMLVGAGPCSTGGGFKVSTLTVLVTRAWSTFRGYSRVHLFRRTLPQQIIERAVATALLFSIVAVVGLMLLLTVEQTAAAENSSETLFRDTAFECVSALGTVGLSTGLTTRLSSVGRIIIIALMFLGRLGPLTVFIALARSERERKIEYASEEPLIG
ncbi:MAG: TrkH family potassium uptake protein [Pirellulales bacterium]